MLRTQNDPFAPLRNLFTRRKPLVVEPSATKSPAEPVVADKGASNPYLEARREWNERYGNYIQQTQQWRLIALLCGAVSLVSVSGVVYIGSQSKVVPYIVEVDKRGMASSVSPAEKSFNADARIIRAYLARFVTDWRTISVDRVAQKNAIDRMYSMLPNGSPALNKLNEHFKANNPFKVASKQRVAVQITDILKISDQTWQVEWEEVTRDLNGELTSSLRIKSSISVGITPPTDERLLLINPLGIYITDLNWSRQL